jgi:predicted DNA-binding transcriptional regulator YafY
MRAGRLISIVLLLQNYRKLTSKELAEQLEVSERTIVRDMEALSGAGVPVYAERGAQGGWTLTEGYRTNLTGMRAEELSSMLIAAQGGLLRDLGLGEHIETAVQKLLAAAPGEASASAADVRQKIHIDGAGWHQQAPDKPDLLPAVQEALWANRKLRLSYIRDGQTARRIVLPLGLVAKRSVWYLVAKTEAEPNNAVAGERHGSAEQASELRQAADGRTIGTAAADDDGLRTYRVSRLDGAEMLEDAFPRPQSFELATYWEQSLGAFKERLPKYAATVRLTETAASRLSRERYIKLLHTTPEGSGWLTAALECQTLESAAEIIMGYGGEIYVLEPDQLRQRIIAGLRSGLKNYE